MCKEIGAKFKRILNRIILRGAMNLFDGSYLVSLLLEGHLEKSIDLDMLLCNA